MCGVIDTKQMFTGGLKVIIEGGDKEQEGNIALADQPLDNFVMAVLTEKNIDSGYEIIGFCKARSQLRIKLTNLH